jgi:hypothetical protein
VSKLLLELGDSRRYIVLAGGGVDANLGQLLDDTNVEVELGRGSSSRAALLALLALLSAGAGEVLLLSITLLCDADTLEARVVNGTLGRGGELAGRGLLLGGESRGVEVADEAFACVDLVLVGRCAGLLETLRGSLLALVGLPLDLLLALALVTGLAGLEVVFLESTLLLVVGVLKLLPGLVLLLLLGTCLVGLLTERLHVLEGLVLLALEDVKLVLQLGVLLAQCLLLRVVEKLLLLRNLCLDVVDALLLRVEAREVLACLVEARDLRQRLLLIDQLHHAAVDLLLQASNLLVHILDRLVVDAALGSLELVQARLELLVQLLDLLEDDVARRLVSLLRLADGVELGLELLLALGVGRVLVVWAGGVELSLAGVLVGC